jgi:hypothetical protein
MWNTIERFYTYKETAKRNELKDKHTILHNKIFKNVLKREGQLASLTSHTPRDVNTSTRQQVTALGKIHPVPQTMLYITTLSITLATQ